MIKIIKRPINNPIHIDSPIINSFCNGEFEFTEEDKKFFGIPRELTQEKKRSKIIPRLLRLL